MLFDIGVVHYVSNEIQAVNIYFLDSKWRRCILMGEEDKEQRSDNEIRLGRKKKFKVSESA